MARRPNKLRCGGENCILWVGQSAEFGDIEPFGFDLGTHANWLNGVDDLEEDKRHAEGPDNVDSGAHQLAEELVGVPVQQAGYTLSGLPHVLGGSDAVPAGAIAAVGKDAQGYSTQRTAVSVDGNCAAG